MCGAGQAPGAAGQAAVPASQATSLLGRPPPPPVRDTANIARRAANRRAGSGTLLTGETTGSVLTG